MWGNSYSKLQKSVNTYKKVLLDTKYESLNLNDTLNRKSPKKFDLSIFRFVKNFLHSLNYMRIHKQLKLPLKNLLDHEIKSI